MELGHAPGLSQHHGLHLTTEIKQGISVLQMNASDLSEYVKTCVEENPFFDDDWVEPLHPYEVDRFKRAESADALLDRRGHGSPENFDNERSSMSQRSFSFDRFLVDDASLEEYLLEQLHLQVSDKRSQAVGEYLIGNIDASGYLRTPVESVAEAVGASVDEVLDILRIIQKFDPPGIGARTLSECLTLQLEAAGRMTPLVKQLIDEHLTEFESRTPAAIAHDMGITLRELSEALDVVRACNPRPAGQFGSPSEPVWPEVVIEPAEEGGFRVHLQDFYLPHLRINEQYRTLASSVKEPGTQTYLKEKLKEAETLMSNITYRKTTLYKVACCIADMQVDFFDKGYDYLRPLTMAQVAQATGVSESTVSRLVNGNYIQTPVGTFELRFFFSSAASNATEAAVSSTSVRHKISELVAAEDPAHPLSDQAIVDALANAGIVLSRRTVNKYRGELGIPARAARRRG